MVLRSEIEVDSLTIGNLEMEVPVTIAPMAGITDYPFRQILWDMGAELCFTEMVSSKGLVYGNEKTKSLLNFSQENKKYIGVQIFGSEPELMSKAASFIEKKYKPDIIDINMGCPAPKIVKNGAGAALMKKIKLAETIIKKVVEAVSLPVTIKMRTGWDQENISAGKIAKISEKNGIKAVTIHGRNRSQFYNGEADWDIIQKIKTEVNIPVIGNGDVFSPFQAQSMLAKTNCDAVMLARGIRGNPWLYKRSREFLKTGVSSSEPTPMEKIDTAIIHLKKAVNYFGEKTAVPRMRKHIGWYIKGLPYSTNIKDKINQISKKKNVIEVLQDYKNKLKKEVY